MTGRVKIQSPNVDVVVKNDGSMKVDDSMRSTLESLGVSTTGFLGMHKSLRVYQRLVDPNQEVLVIGRIPKSDGAVMISGKKIDPVIISNMGRPEMIKTLAWKVAKTVGLSVLIGAAFLLFWHFL